MWLNSPLLIFLILLVSGDVSGKAPKGSFTLIRGPFDADLFAKNWLQNFMATVFHGDGGHFAPSFIFERNKKIYNGTFVGALLKTLTQGDPLVEYRINSTENSKNFVEARVFVMFGQLDYKSAVDMGVSEPFSTTYDVTLWINKISNKLAKGRQNGQEDDCYHAGLWCVEELTGEWGKES